jgi:hypothetical protein
VSLVEQELPTLPDHMSSPLVFSGVRVTRSLVLYVCFVDRCLSFCIFSFGHCVVCSTSLYRFWLPLWCLQTLLKVTQYTKWLEDNQKITVNSICSHLYASDGEYFSTRCWYIPNFVLKDKIRRYFRNPTLNILKVVSK